MFTFDRMSLHARGLPLAIPLLLGCGGGTPTESPCTHRLAECLSFQQTCVVNAGVAECQHCPAGHWANTDGSCVALTGEAIHHEFTTFTVKAGEEIRGLCQSWSLNNPEELWVSAVEFAQNLRSHHSIWTFAPPEEFPGPDGVWECAERNYNELVGTLAGGVLYAQSTQTEYEIQRFPTGSAVRIPPYSMIVGDVHLLNSGVEDVTGSHKLTIYTRPRAEVTVPLVPFQFDFHDLAIPAKSRTRVSTTCEVGRLYNDHFASPFDMKVHYLLPHTHEYGRRFFAEAVGGPAHGAVLIDARGFQEEARGRFYDPPIDISGAESLRFGCEYENTTDSMLEYGYDQEMCQALGFAEAKVAFLGIVNESSALGVEDGMNQLTGPCELLAVEWNHDKPGGDPP